MGSNAKRQRLYFNSIERRKRRTKIKKRITNFKKVKSRSNIRSFELDDRKKRRSRFYKQQPLEILIAPALFTLFNHTENVISFINEIDKCEKKRRIRSIKFELKEIIEIDIGAISLLLSKINELSSLNINFIGTLPKNEIAKSFIIDSGFLDKMKNLKTGKNFIRSSKNLIVNRGFDRIDNKTTAEEIKKCVEHLTGISEYFQPVYSIIVEICSNSVEHANEEIRKKNWVIATNYLDDEVQFTLTDIGEGIIKTIKKKKMHDLFRITGILKTTEIMINAFNKEYESRTLDTNRNKGLPRIFDVSNKKYIDNLIVISNNVFLDFNNHENTRVLKKNFRGTFYFWRINKKCIDLWKKRIL